MFAHGVRIRGANDCKKLSPKKRQEFYLKILAQALGVGVGVAGVEEIDRLNILNATRVAMERAIQGMEVLPDYLLIDAVRLHGVSIPQEAIIKGDTLSHSIACASIVAKVSRDRMMDEIHTAYPEYGFSLHKGYATRFHVAQIRRLGPLPLHRRTFLKKILSPSSAP
jgi:ribonuclease HII